MTLCSIHSGMTFSFQFCFFLSQYFHGCPVWTWFLWCMFPENAPRKRGAFEIHFLNRIECQQNKHYKMKVKSKTHSLLLLLSLLNKNNTNTVLPMWFADADDAYLFISNFEHKSNSVHIHELCVHCTHCTQIMFMTQLCLNDISSISKSAIAFSLSFNSFSFFLSSREREKNDLLFLFREVKPFNLP